MLKNLLLILFILPLALKAQTTITGKVLDKAGKPAPFVTVFLSQTTNGTMALADGSFVLNGVKDGSYDFVISGIGYQTYHQNLKVNGVAVTLKDITLTTKATSLNEVTIKSKADPNRKKYLAIFASEFLGNTANAKRCKIINPGALNFEYDKTTKELKASTDTFLIIDNNALGYRVKYLVKSFIKKVAPDYTYYEGSTVFEPLQGTAAQQSEWAINRNLIYQGSTMHFLRSGLKNFPSPDPKTGEYIDDYLVQKIVIRPNPDRPADSVIKARLKEYGRRQTGFKSEDDTIRYYLAKERLAPWADVKIDTPLKKAAFINLTTVNGVFMLGYPEKLAITYKKTAAKSTIRFNKEYAVFDVNGVIRNPASSTLEGAWAAQRVADQLPDNYEAP